MPLIDDKKCIIVAVHDFITCHTLNDYYSKFGSFIHHLFHNVFVLKACPHYKQACTSLQHQVPNVFLRPH